MHEEKGVKFKTGVNVKEFEGTGGKVSTCYQASGIMLVSLS